MARMTKRVLTDEQWQRIERHLPKYKSSPKGGRPRASDRESMEGILWLLRTGARWRDIPVDLPSGCTCWRRLQEWAGEGILEEVHSALIEELGELGQLHLKELVMDATFIRAKKGGTKSGLPSAAKA
jgi:transposase